mmetsp:Transcript_13795/g.44152  ORF Transcript_13795/g.44152 Transcript_13795/m.44152 type:complete len:317 (+) Transcript_13795:68-1018(+)|eukprot:CAMPEP_0196770154 /NCGR_PEP_ID=MMETSP1104-20130614/974_1 /TAXON_ID=33652 /ORGANISM="Cafeteria sp., Strain Caron Lab Isolate" /LENGTH=316 /DNA_ID=CAMNT_0042140263 /DNA_START=61 /DNA_END=1011 /DNA_ORIENTATION=+
MQPVKRRAETSASTLPEAPAAKMRRGAAGAALAPVPCLFPLGIRTEFGTILDLGMIEFISNEDAAPDYVLTNPHVLKREAIERPGMLTTGTNVRDWFDFGRMIQDGLSATYDALVLQSTTNPAVWFRVGDVVGDLARPCEALRGRPARVPLCAAERKHFLPEVGYLPVEAFACDSCLGGFMDCRGQVVSVPSLKAIVTSNFGITFAAENKLDPFFRTWSMAEDDERTEDCSTRSLEGLIKSKDKCLLCHLHPSSNSFKARPLKAKTIRSRANDTELWLSNLRLKLRMNPSTPAAELIHILDYLIHRVRDNVEVLSE